LPALLLVMLIGALNYNLGLGFALTFLTGACAVADMYLTAKNLAMLQLRPAARRRVRRRGSAVRTAPAQPHQAASIATPSGSASRPTASRARRSTCRPAAPARMRCRRIADGARLAGGAARAAGHALSARPVRAWSYWRPDAKLLVYPAPETPAPPLPSSGAASEDGHGTVGLDNFAGIRSYQPGDPMRHLAWRQIARHDPALGGQLVTKHFEGGAVAELCSTSRAAAAAGPGTALSRMTRWVLEAEQRALPYTFRLAQHEYGRRWATPHQAACLRALALFGMEDRHEARSPTALACDKRLTPRCCARQVRHLLLLAPP
jgi:hypothetical protein